MNSEINHPGIRILHLEDSPPDAEIIRERLIDAGFSLHLDQAANEKEFNSFLQIGGYDIVLADYQLPGFDAPLALRMVQAAYPGLPFICVSGAVGEEKAVELLKLGATDYVPKSRLEKLPLAMIRALDEVRERTARQLAEETLRENEERYRSIIRTSMDGFWAIDLDGRFQEVNDAYLAMSGYTRSNLLSMSVADIEITESPDMVREHLGRIIAQGYDRFESRHRRADGHVMHVQVSVIALVSQNLMICFISDITERKQSEDKMRKLSQAVEQSPVSIVITDTKGYIEFVNPKFTQITGYEADEALGRNPRILKSDHYSADVYQNLWATISSGGVWEGEFLNKKRTANFFGRMRQSLRSKTRTTPSRTIWPSRKM